MVKELNDLIRESFEIHKSAVEVWEHGDPVSAEIGPDKVLKIKYESGKWWHYRDINGYLEWW